MIGQTISHYKILEKLGEGGMGEVYLAEDVVLGRRVAVKFLSSDKATDLESRKRFVHEARAQAMLSHPNIATFHEVGEALDKVFIVMEYIEGRPLSQLASVEKLSLAEVLDLAIQVGEGLSAAHEKGVVHRDIKPENVLVTSKHHAKITDFGLAKWKGASTLTQTGARLGTAYYMSPEQVEGKKADHRTGIFSLGIVLYELLCARRPFEGDTETAIFYDLINTQPQPLARFTRNLPEKLEQIVMKCLAKKPEERYQHADELVSDLKTLRRASEIQNAPISLIRSGNKRKRVVALSIGAAAILVGVGAYLLLPRFFASSRTASAGRRKMLAVLPFRNLGPSDQEYFADAITDEITGNLAKVSGLGVISNTSASQYKKTGKNLRQIGSELGADYVLEGTIAWDKSGGASRVRISPQLIRVKDDTHLWAESYDRVFEQIFALQSEVAQKVTSALDVALLEPERRSLEARPTENSEAYEYYLQGNDYFNRGYAKKDLQIALQMYQKAVELDSNFALAYAKLSKTHSGYYWSYYDRTDERLTKAKEAVDKALQLKPDLPEVHLSLGFYHFWSHLDYDRALEEFAIAEKSQPNNSDLFAAVGYVQRRQGKWEQALANFKKAAELDPRSNIKAFDVGFTCRYIRNYPEAERYFDRAISVAPDWDRCYREKASLYVASEGSTAKARKVLQAASEKVAPEELASMWWWLEVLDGNYQKALGYLSGPNVFDNDTAAYFARKAELYGLMNQPRLKQAYYDSFRIVVEKRVAARPQEADYHDQLGIAYAGLGRKEEAIREGKKAVELLPVSKDAFHGSLLLWDLAWIYVMVGEYNAAIDELEYVLSIPSWTTIPLLRIEPNWVPLRNNPRFKKLLASSPPAPSP